MKEHIVFTGQRQDIAHVLAAMDTFALVSRKEAGPLAVLEAMSTGLPVLATNVGMLPDFVRDGVGGSIVDVGDIAAIADRLTAMALDPAKRRAMGEAAHQIVRDEYDVEIAGPKIEAILARGRANQEPAGAWVRGRAVRERLAVSCALLDPDACYDEPRSA